MTQPLDGVRVVDLTRILSGPFCSMLLADMGADVIKIEPPGTGDPVRGQGAGHNGLSWYFAAFNRNKRSVTLDLKREEGLSVLARLIENADVLVENYRPGVLAKMGFDPERLEALNPRLIVASVNGYGSVGPYVDRPAFDFIAQAMSGFMSVNGEPDGPPLRCGPPLTDLIAGLYAAFGVVSALRAREMTGRGQRVEAAMTNSVMSLFAYLASDYFATGRLPVRAGNDHPIASPYGLFSCKDGQVAVAPSTNAVLRRLFEVLDLPDPLADPELDTMEKRVRHRARLNRMIDERMREETQDVWIERLNKAGVPCGRVQDLAEAFADPQVMAQEMAIDVPHPGRGVVRMLGFPVKLSDTPCAVRHPTPELGADVDAVLREIGYDDATIRDLRDRTIV